MSSTKMGKKCERCTHLAPLGNRFCKDCVRQLKEEMTASGYLQRVPQSRAYRGGEKQEDTYETKFGGNR